MNAKPYRRAYVGGTFDTFHRGHSNLLYSAKRLANEVVVSLNTDEFAERYKRRPSQGLGERVVLVSLCLPVDLVVVNVGGEDSRTAIEVVRPDVIIHGDDWVGSEYLAQLGVTQDWLDERGIDVVYLPYTPGVSTTELLEEQCRRKTAAS